MAVERCPRGQSARQLIQVNWVAQPQALALTLLEGPFVLSVWSNSLFTKGFL